MERSAGMVLTPSRIGSYSPYPRTLNRESLDLLAGYCKDIPQIGSGRYLLDGTAIPEGKVPVSQRAKDCIRIEKTHTKSWHEYVVELAED